MSCDFWQDANSRGMKPIRATVTHDRTFWNKYEYSGLDYERIKAYMKALDMDIERTIIDAKFLNGMEEWYLELAEREYKTRHEL